MRIRLFVTVLACSGLLSLLGCGGRTTTPTEVAQEKATESGKSAVPPGMPQGVDMTQMYKSGGAGQDMSKMKQDMSKQYPGGGYGPAAGGGQPTGNP